MLKNSFVSMITAFNIQKERIAKRFIINFFLLSSFLTLLAKISFANFAQISYWLFLPGEKSNSLPSNRLLLNTYLILSLALITLIQ